MKQPKFELFLCTRLLRDAQSKEVLYNAGTMVLVTGIPDEFKPYFLPLKFVKGEFKIKEIKVKRVKLKAKKVAKK